MGEIRLTQAASFLSSKALAIFSPTSFVGAVMKTIMNWLSMLSCLLLISGKQSADGGSLVNQLDCLIGGTLSNLINPILVTGIKHRHNIFGGNQILNIMNIRKHKSAAGSQIIYIPANLLCYLLRRAKRQCFLRITCASPEDNIITKILFKSCCIHPSCRHLNRINDIHTNVNQIGNPRSNSTTTMEKYFCVCH